MDHVTVLHGDTHVSQQGTGTFGSRSAVVGGGALATAAERVIDKGKRIAAHLVEAAPEDIVQADGGFAVKGVPEKKISWRQIAAAAYGGRVPTGHGDRPAGNLHSSIPSAKPGASAPTSRWSASTATPVSSPLKNW